MAPLKILRLLLVSLCHCVINLISHFCSEFICDTLTNSCKANQTAKDVCAKAQTAALAAASKTGAQADAFNAVFGITTVNKFPCPSNLFLMAIFEPLDLQHSRRC